MAHPHLTLRPGHPDPSTATDAEAVRPAAAPALVEAFEAIRAEHEIPAEFPPEVLAEAEEVAGTDVLPVWCQPEHASIGPVLTRGVDTGPRRLS